MCGFSWAVRNVFRPLPCNHLAMEDWGLGSEAIHVTINTEVTFTPRKDLVQAEATTQKAKGKAKKPKRKATTPTATGNRQRKAAADKNKAEADKRKAKAQNKKAKAVKKSKKAKAKPRPVQGSPDGDRGPSSNMPYHFSAVVAQRGLNLASDCSGWCVEGLAAELVSDEHINHVFASDSCAAVRTS